MPSFDGVEMGARLINLPVTLFPAHKTLTDLFPREYVIL